MSTPIYFDNAATSFPKAPGVSAEMKRYLDEVGAPVGRASYAAAAEADGVMLRLREALCRIFSCADPKYAILTPGCTAALNMAILGGLSPGDLVLVSSMEHNAVMRPLRLIGAQVEVLACSSLGVLDPDDVERRASGGAKMLIVNHASNVCGTVQDAKAIGEICERHGLIYILDIAGSAGHMPVSLAECRASALCLPAHKGLLAAPGIGAMLLSRDYADHLRPIMAGGTGSHSHEEFQPTRLPDKFELGTPNIPGAYGFLAALSYLEKIGLRTLMEQEERQCRRILAGLSGISGVHLRGPSTAQGRTAVFSLTFDALDPADAASLLERRFGILTRCGLHCAPAAHRTLGTFPTGTVRLSPSIFHTEAELDTALNAVRAVAKLTI